MTNKARAGSIESQYVRARRKECRQWLKTLPGNSKKNISQLMKEADETRVNFILSKMRKELKNASLR